MKRSADSAFVLEDSPEPDFSPAQSPAPSSSSSDCPPRKRSRSEMSPEERKEARAHRNRIAAQNSRDRRKAQFSYLERRVAELEEENRQLRAGMGSKRVSASDAQADQLARDKAREQENEELRERIKTLENGWDAVVKALAASGLPLNVPGPLTAALPSPSTSSASSRVPVVAPPTPISPVPSTPDSSMFEFEDFEPTRHLARVATTDAPLLSSLKLELRPNLPSPAMSAAPAPNSIAPATAPIDESAMEDLFREILAPSPTLPTTPIPSGTRKALAESATSTPAGAQVAASPLPGATLDWEGEAEMQRLLDMLPDVQPDGTQRIELNVDSVDFPSALDLDLCAWNMASTVPPPSLPTSVGVF